MDPLMMLVYSHHSLSLQKDSPSNHRLHQKEKDNRNTFFFFFELHAQYKTKTRNKEYKRNKIGCQQETKGKMIVNLILEPRL
jgi:hypothetical protein